MKNFAIKPDIKMGQDSLSYLNDLSYKNYLLVTDKIMVDLKLVDTIIDNLNTNCKIKIFDKVLPNPDTDVIARGVMDYIKFEPDCVIALGGGSVIDACKGIMYFGDKVLELLKIKNDREFIAIPTTSGTGSEVTSYSVITNGDSKVALAEESMLPDVALLNPEFMKTLPKKVVADTGLDVLTHALEAYVSTNSNMFTDAFALEAIQSVFHDLLPHYEDRSLLTPRENIQYASCMAGVAFNNSSLGINHSIAHSIGAKFHIPHGRANAIVLPYVIEVNTNAYARYSKLAKNLGIPVTDDKQGTKAFKMLVELLKEKMEIPKSLSELGIKFKDFKEVVPDIISDIKKDICTEYNPNRLTDEEYIELLMRIYLGK